MFVLPPDGPGHTRRLRSFWLSWRRSSDVLLDNAAGGNDHVTGDYLFRDLAGPGFDGGLWGILRVLP